ncbi:MAG TPA: ABC transporter permease [Thermoplasmata archaeon]|nr:ABC transporter permease [Thermoplasmata archaeon]
MTAEGTPGTPGRRSPASVTSAVPRSIDQILILARYQLRDYIRSRRFMILFALITVIGGIITAVVGYYRPAFLDSAASFYATIWGSGVTFVIVLAGIFFGGDAIAGEFQNRTGYFLMGLPIRRITVYAGKYIAALVASFAILLYFAAILLANGIFYFGGGAFPWQFGASFGLASVYILALLGATFLFSSMFKTSTYATLLTAVLFLFGFTILEALVSGLAGSEPWMIISYSDGIIANIFVDPYPPHVVTTQGPGGNSFTQYNPTIGTGVGIMVAYFVLSGLGGLFFFERKEFS